MLNQAGAEELTAQTGSMHQQGRVWARPEVARKLANEVLVARGDARTMGRHLDTLPRLPDAMVSDERRVR